MSQKVHVYKVEMSCGGCSSAVQKVLDKHKGEGIDDVSIDLGSQRVTVTSSKLSSDEILAIIKKTGKTSEYLGLQNED